MFSPIISRQWQDHVSFPTVALYARRIYPRQRTANPGRRRCRDSPASASRQCSYALRGVDSTQTTAPALTGFPDESQAINPAVARPCGPFVQGSVTDDAIDCAEAR